MLYTAFEIVVFVACVALCVRTYFSVGGTHYDVISPARQLWYTLRNVAPKR
jgi:hypothetical protein